jgi:hypothetical protein
MSGLHDTVLLLSIVARPEAGNPAEDFLLAPKFT